MSQIKDYFHNQLRNFQNIVLRQVHMDLLDCKNRVTRDLIIGQLQINQQSSCIQKPVQSPQKEQQLISKRLLMQKQIINLKREDFQNQQDYKRAKQQIILQRQEEIRAQKNQKQRKVKQIEQRVKSWSVEQKQLNRKKLKKMQQQQKMRQREQENQKQRREKAKILQKLEKKKLIQDKIRSIEENKLRRQQLYKISKSQSVDKPPLYLQIEKRYNQLEEQHKFQEKIQKKNHLIAMKINYDDLKQHEKNVLSKMDQRKKKQEQNKARFENQRQKNEFIIYSNKSIQKTKQQEEKKNRRWKYLQTIKSIPISIDQSKKLKIQIEVDKAKNPFKYNFLSQKALNQFQIFGQFQNFSFKSDPKQLGDQYLQQSKKFIKLPSVQRSKSVQIINQSRMTEKPQYRNYLAQLKSKRPETQSRASKQGQQDQIEKLLKSKDKKRAIEQLSYRSKQLEMNAMKKIQQLKKMDPQDIKSFMRKQSQIDNDYTKALKARIAALQISN